jgi:multidrug efflux system outer membrane protein
MKVPVGVMPLIFLAVIAGCASVGPDYSPPDVKVPEQWSEPAAETQPAGAVGLSTWWQYLNDPLLAGLIQNAISGNNDIKTAISRVRQSRATLGISQAGEYPTLDATGQASRSHRKSTTSGQTTTTDTDSYSIGLDASWEIDLFGGTRRAIEAARADLSAQEESLRDVQVTLVADVALNYIQIREYQKRIEVTENNLAALREEAAIAEARKEAGLVSDLDIVQADAALASTEAQLPSLRAGLNTTLNSTAILLGMQPGALNEELSTPAPIPSPPEGIETGVPADLLRRRPDIRQAERQLAAETARVGVVEADLYPRFSLTGSFVYQELKTSSEGVSTTTDSQTTSFGPTLNWPIFRAGAIRRNIDVQDAKQEQALIAYEQTVLNALGEVENALRSYRETQRESDLLSQAVESARETEQLENIRYQTGLSDFESLITARKNLLSLEDRLASSQASLVSELIRLYKALGGGWAYERAQPTQDDTPRT